MVVMAVWMSGANSGSDVPLASESSGEDGGEWW